MADQAVRTIGSGDPLRVRFRAIEERADTLLEKVKPNDFDWHETLGGVRALEADALTACEQSIPLGPNAYADRLRVVAETVLPGDAEYQFRLERAPADDFRAVIQQVRTIVGSAREHLDYVAAPPAPPSATERFLAQHGAGLWATLTAAVIGLLQLAEKIVDALAAKP